MHRVENLHADPFQFHSLHTEKYVSIYIKMHTNIDVFSIYICILLSIVRIESVNLFINMYDRWVEMMAPVFSSASWRCAWHMIQVVYKFFRHNYKAKRVVDLDN